MKKVFLPLFLLMLGLPVSGQQPGGKLKIYYDCHARCYVTYMKQNLPQVEFVRDRQFADVHIIILSETNASGGATYHLQFHGQNRFKGEDQEWKFSVSSENTDEEVRDLLFKYLKMGLLKYWAQMGLADKVDVRIQSRSEQAAVKDPWNHWIYRISASGWFNGNSNNKSANINGSLSASRVTDALKFSFRMYYGTGRSSYRFGQQIIRSFRESFSASLSEILSINQHWSYGFFGDFNRSKYQNYAQSYNLYGGLEYSFFPYKESSKRSLVLNTRLGMAYNKYFETTIYNKTQEWLYLSQWNLSGKIVKKWGDIGLGLDYSTYLHNLQLHSLGANAQLSLRLVKGLRLNLSGYYSITHDQINIAAGNRTLEEILLAQKELLSDYDYFTSVGISYSFGSIYNTIVNPRFGSSGGSRVVYFF